MREALEAHTPGPAPTLEDINARLGEVSNGARAQWGGEQSRAGGAAPGANLSRGRAARARRAGSDAGADSAGEGAGV
jgi:5-methyltetrahydrofolate--homocysteine methyltransferase